jgi:S1-C subfamily serine protease
MIAAEVPELSQAESKAQTPVPTATPGAPVVVLPAESASLMSAYEGALTQIYETVNPSVVNIRVLTRASGLGFSLPEQGIPQIPGLPFDFGPFGNEPDQEQPDPEAQPYAQGQGSGFVWDKEGHIVTNNHVVNGAEKIEVTFSDGTAVPAELVGADKDSDLAVIKVDLPADQLKPVQLADSKSVKVGELAIAIGNPYGLEGSMTVGIISAVGRTTPGGESQIGSPSYSIPDVIQTDAPINPGNSGGPLVNDQGQVVGVTYMIESASGSNAGIGFVIPSSLVSRVIPTLIENGAYEHPYLGISGISLTPALAEAMDLDPMQRGVMVGDLTPGGPAEKGGLKGSQSESQVDGQQVQIGGDVIIAIDGSDVKSMDDLIAYLGNSTTVGQDVSLTVLRDGKETTVEVTLEARPTVQANQQPSAELPLPRQGEQSDRPWIGITAGSLVPSIAEAMDLPADQSGVLVEQVASDSPADQAGLRGSDRSATIDGQPVMIGGDVIIAIDGKQIGSMEDLAGLLDDYKPGDQVTLTILRDGEQVELELTLGNRPAAQ